MMNTLSIKMAGIILLFLLFKEIEYFYNRISNENMSRNKATFKTENGATELIKAFFKMRPQIYQLINQPTCAGIEAKQILGIVNSLPKRFQRSKNLYNELLLSEEVTKIVDYFVGVQYRSLSLRKRQTKKSTLKYKPYELLVLFWQLSQIIINRLASSVSGSLQEIKDNSENYKLFYFANQLQNLTEQIQNWAKSQEKNVTPAPHQSIQFIYPEGSTNRKTLATTTDGSKNISRHEKHLTFDQFTHKNSSVCGLRASTAKIKARDIKLTSRCPSATSLKKSKKQTLRNKHKSTDFQDKTNRNSYDLETNIQVKRSSKFRSSKLQDRKTSILFKEDEDVFRVSSIKRIQNQGQKLKKAGMRFLANRKKQINFFTTSQSEISSNKNSKDQNRTSQFRIQDPQTCGDKKNHQSTNEIKVESCNDVGSELSDENSLQQSYCSKQKNTVYIKQRHFYKKVRRSGKGATKVHKETKEGTSFIKSTRTKEPSNFSKRRKAMVSSQNIQVNQNQFVSAQNQPHDPKQINYEDLAMVGITAIFKSKKNLKKQKEANKTTQQGPDFNSMFHQMNAFLKDYHMGKPNQQPQSVFFEQQKRIKCFQDYNFHQIMKQIKQKNGYMNVFQIATTQTNNKDQIYNQVHRHLTFNSDSQWIKNINTSKQTLVQRDI